MGEAKRRGTREQRVERAEAIAAEEARVRLESQMAKRRQFERDMEERRQQQAAAEAALEAELAKLTPKERALLDARKVRLRAESGSAFTSGRRGKSFAWQALAMLAALPAQSVPTTRPDTLYIDESTKLR